MKFVYGLLIPKTLPHLQNSMESEDLNKHTSLTRDTIKNKLFLLVPDTEVLLKSLQ